MTGETMHEYQIGDSVLVNLNGAQIPGVIEDEKNNQWMVRIAQPWTDESGRQSDEVWVTQERLTPSREETGGTAALPG